MRRVRVLPGQLRLDLLPMTVRRRVPAEQPAPEPETLPEQIRTDERECRRLHLWRGRPAVGKVA